MFYYISKVILKILGWKIVGDFPHHIKKMVLVAGPHTSNWDFPLGLMVRSVIEADIKYIGKDSLFRPPLSWITKPLGGIPVDRSRSNNFVDAAVAKFDSVDELAILLAPEGSRKKVDKLKTGYYHIARQANVPMLPTILDYATKEFKFLDLIWATEDQVADLEKIENIFRGVEGYHLDKSFV